jgi:phage gpG-like protein
MAAKNAYVIFKDLGLNNLRKKMEKAAKGIGVKAGVQEGSNRKDGELSNASLAVIHEYGTSTIPARPFIGPTATKKQDSWYKLLGQLVGKIDFTNPKADDIRDAFATVGMRMAADMRKTVRDGLSPPLNPKTIERKGSSKPLIDSGQLVGSITSQIEDKGVK